MNRTPNVPRHGQRAAAESQRKPAISLQPQVYRDLLHGTDLIANAIRPSMGPLPRMVVVERPKRTEAPEFLDDGATIARRIIQVGPRGSDVGAMLLRHALWQMHNRAGDGTATMAMMYQTLLREGVRHITQGNCDAMQLRSALERACQAVMDALRREATPLQGRRALAQVALGLCQSDPCMAEMIGEILDCVGPDGLIEVEGSQRLGVEREYIEGTYWKLSGWLSRMFTEGQPQGRAVMDYPSILITDMDIQSPAMLIPVMQRCLAEDIRQLVIIAKDVSDAITGLLVNNNRAGTVQTLAVRTPKVAEMDRVAAIEDIATLTGGRPFYAAAFDNLNDFRVVDLGHAKRAWAMESLFGIHGGMGDAGAIQQRKEEIRRAMPLAETEAARREMQSRIGRMSGQTAILRVGALHETEREARKGVAERAVAGLRNAMQHGVVAGGGAALIHIQAVMQNLPDCSDAERVAKKMMQRALEAPARAIVANAGGQPDLMAERIRSAPRGHGVDARTMQIVDCHEAGILDSAFVLQNAIDIAVSGAVMALTTDVIVHHRAPAASLEP